MSEAFPHLFEPITIRGVTVKNRLTFGAHTANMSVDGLPGARHLGYYRERAIGGAGMIVVEPVPVHRTAVLTRGNFRHEDDSIIPHFQKITDACHEHGTVMIQQLYHVGQHGDWALSFQPNWSPSGLPSMHDQDGSHAMTRADIEEIVESFAAAALRAKLAGFEGCELMAAYNAIIEQFWSSMTNRRDDEYGGSFENRMRFSVDILSRIRARVGDDFIIGVCVSVDDTAPDVLSVEDQQAIASYHDERALFDYITCGTGGYYSYGNIIPNVVHPDRLGAPYAEALKQVVKHAKVQCESHIRTPDAAENIIASGQADLVSIVRGQIADPHLAAKARLGRAEDIRPCLSCNQQCIARRHRDYWISCLINPSAGREWELGGDRFKPAARAKRVLVVGGGPAGCEVARVAAERGHQVTLVEASDRLGGQFRLAGLQPRRGQILDYLDWFERQLQKLQVRVRFNEYMEANEVKTFAANVVVLATGSLPTQSGWQRGLPTRDELPGISKSNVCTVEDIMSRSARPGHRVLLLDDVGTWKGVGTAWYLAERGHAITIITPSTVVGREVGPTGADYGIRQALAKACTRFIHESAIDEWHGDAATILNFLSGERYRESFDTLVLATVNEPLRDLSEELGDSGMQVHSIGDCLSARQTPAATYEARILGISL
jgi:2,4-dienoyl-CoA reductase-like NADH-dependent reductase (Old Yellow Enzyme family)/thioredoxin reductase